MKDIHKEIMSDAIKECIELNEKVILLKRTLAFSIVVNIAMFMGLLLCMIGI